ncbi:MAG: C4-type zinc ribbon domain-containing protein [Fimbriimonadales bacterium]
MHADMHLLYELQQLDARIEKLRTDLRSLDSGETMRRRLDQNRQQLEHVKEQHHELALRARDQELKLKGQEEKLRRLEADLYSGRIRNPKELEALQHEIDSLKNARDEMDMELLRIWEQMETTEAGIKELEAELDQMEQLYQQHMARYRETRSALEAELAAQEQQREALIARIQPAVVERYEKLRQRLHGIAVARVENKTCTACHTTLTDYLAKRLESESGLVTCESCGRLLFDPAL